MHFTVKQIILTFILTKICSYLSVNLFFTDLEKQLLSKAYNSTAAP